MPRKGERNRGMIFRYIDFFENYIRKLISKELEKCYGKKWWKAEGVYEDIKEYCEEKRNREIEKGKKEEPLILNYADFSHYSKIIAKRNNWDKIFKHLFKDETDRSVESRFVDLKKLRDITHHHRGEITGNQVLEAEILISKLCVDEKAKREFEELVKKVGKEKLPIHPTLGITIDKDEFYTLIRGIIKELEEEYGKEVPIGKVFDLAEEKGIERGKAEEVIEVMKRNGTIYAPRNGVIKFVR